MRGPRHLVFDMDGTLVDSMNQQANAFSDILYRKFRIPRDICRQEYHKTAGQPADEQLAQVVRLWTGKFPTDTSGLLDDFWDLISALTPNLFPEVKDCLRVLNEAGYKLFLSSSCAPYVVDSKMRKANIDHFFLLMLGTDKHLPDMIKGEGHFKTIRRQIGLTLSEFSSSTAMIGDGLYDIKIGLEAGLLTIGRATNGNSESLKEARAAWVVDDLTQLVDYLRNKESPTDLTASLSASGG